MTEYVAVTGGAHPVALSKFNNYLVSIGEPTTARNWTLESVVRHTKRIVKDFNKVEDHINLFLDSG